MTIDEAILDLSATKSKVAIAQRAVIAFRSLTKTEQGQASRAIKDLQAIDLNHAPGEQKLVEWKTGLASKMYQYKAGPKLRMLLSLSEDRITIEDLAYQDRLSHLAAERGVENGR